MRPSGKKFCAKFKRLIRQRAAAPQNDTDRNLHRHTEQAMVECKARANIVSGDIKDFAYDVLIAGQVDYGYFVHTSELQHQAAGMVKELQEKEPKRLIFWGPSKIIELLQHSK